MLKGRNWSCEKVGVVLKVNCKECFGEEQTEGATHIAMFALVFWGDGDGEGSMQHDGGRVK